MATVQQTFDFCSPATPRVADLAKDWIGVGENVQSLASSATADPKTKLLSQAETAEPRDGVTGLQGTAEPRDGVTGLQSVTELQQPDRDAVLRQLRAKVGCVNTATDHSYATLSTGCHAINAMLPNGGLRVDALAEWVGGAASGAAALSMISVAEHLRAESGPLVIVDADKTFYPPAAIALGVPIDRIILVRPSRHCETVWAIDQALRCDAVAAVWAQVGTRLDDRDARRFQLAAEIGHTPGFLVRPEAARGRPSFAEVRFHVSNEKGVRTLLCEAPEGPLGQKGPDPFFVARSPATASRGYGNGASRTHKVTLDRCRGGVIGQNTWVQIDDQAHIHHVSITESTCHETAAVHLASQLANPTTAQSPGRRTA